jgi:uncharacterized membrane protein (UPF0136 family)
MGFILWRTQIVTLIIAFYGLFVALGGIMGYLKAKSRVSLTSGLGSAVALWIAAFQSLSNLLGGLIASVLTIFFSLRWIKTRAFMPAGLMSILSFLITALFLGNLTAMWMLAMSD